MSPRCLLAVLAPFLGGSGRRGWGDGGRPRCPSSSVSTSQARRKHEARHLSLCRGGGLPCGSCRRPSYPAFAPRVPPPAGLARRVLPTGTVVWSVPHPHSAASPPCRFVLGGGGRCPPLPTFIPHPWGGGGVWGGGGKPCSHPFVARMLQARRKHGAGTRRGTCPSAGGGACLVAAVVALPTLCSHPRWSPRCGLHGACSLRAQSCGPFGTLSPLPPHPAALSSGRFSPPPTCIPHPWGGGGVCGGEGALVVFPPQHARRRHDASMAQARGAALVPLQGGGLPCVTRCCPSYPACAPPGGQRCEGGGAPLSLSLHCTHVAGTTQARRKHGVRHFAAAGGVYFLLGLPALLHDIGSAPQDLQPLSSLGGSRHVCAWCSVYRACSLLCPYVLEEVRTRSETDDEEVRAAGRTYRTPRRLLAPSVALVEGRAPVSVPNCPGGWRLPILSLAPVYPLPSGLIPVPWYQSAGSGGYKAARRSRPPGLCHPRARWRPLRSYGRDAGRRAGDSFVASPGHRVNQHNRCRKGAHRMALLVPVSSAPQ